MAPCPGSTRATEGLLMPNIGIVGCGVSALHLALLLRRNDVHVTIYSERSGPQIRAGRLLNSVAHHRLTLNREQALGIDHWDVSAHGYGGHTHYIGGPQPLHYRGDFQARSRAVDYRVYLPRLMEDVAELGGEIRVGPFDVAAVAERHDLVVVAGGRGPLAELFPPRPDRSMSQPMRRLTCALYRGIGRSEPLDVTISVVPGHGEIVELPILSLDGPVTALLFEAVPGGEIDAISGCSYGDDPSGFEKTVLNLLERHAPITYARVDVEAFGVTRPLDVLQGAITGCLRRDWAHLPNGRPVLAMGDAHCLIDPIAAQGANMASYSAEIVGQAILEDQGLDEAFCERVAGRRRLMLEAAYDWTRATGGAPSPQSLMVIIAMSMNKAVCDEFTDNFSFPDRQWATLRSMEAVRAHLDRFGIDADEMAAAAGVGQ